jgi:glycosyltransferase involved in cell wall biosynthesis
MKVVHITPLYPPSIGGNQLQTALLSEEMAKLDVDVTVYTTNVVDLMDLYKKPASKFLLKSFEVRNSVKVKRFDVNNGLRRFLFEKLYKIRGGYRLVQTLLGDLTEYWRHGPITLKMFWELMKDKPDLVMVSNNYAFQGVIGFFAKHWFNMPFVFIPITHIHHPSAYDPAVKKILEKADSVIACTEFEKQFLIKQGLPEQKIVSIPLGIDCRFASSAYDFRKEYGLSQELIVGYIGRKIDKKGVNHLVEAMRIVWKRYPQTRLLLAGKLEKDYEGTFDALIKSLSSDEQKRLIVINEMDDNQKNGMYRALDLFVMVSQIDSFGIVYLESWLFGKPVVGARNTPQETVIDHEHDGLLVEYGNVSELAQAIEKILSNKFFRETLGRNGQEKVLQKHQIGYYARCVLNEYEKVLGKI